MSTFHYPSNYGHLESMIEDLNLCLRRLNSYLSTELNTVSSSTTISDLSDLLLKLKSTDQLCLSVPITLSLPITNIKEVIGYSALSEECRSIEEVWRECRNVCDDVKNVIDEIREAINALTQNTVTNNTNMSQLISICGSKKSSLGHLIDSAMLKTIYDDTINSHYKSKSSCKITCTCWAGVLATILIAVLIYGFFCSCPNISGKNIIINEKNVGDSLQSCSCEIKVKKISRSGSFIIGKNGYDIGFQIQLFNDSAFILDSTSGMQLDLNYLKSDSSISKITITPNGSCEATSHFTTRDYTVWSSLFRLLIIAILATALTMTLVILKRQSSKENEMNQKILNEKLKVQNEWQEILQSRYRLAIRRQELDMNIEEKERKAQIDKSLMRSEHDMKIEADKQMQKFELMAKAIDAFLSNKSQRPKSN